MKTVTTILITFVAIQHFGFLVLEMFFWTKPIGMQIFATTPEFAAQSSTLAANQGLYNGFLAAGLTWSLLRQSDAHHLQVFFLACVVAAGIFGGLTVKTSILLVQGTPALLALILVLATRRRPA